MAERTSLVAGERIAHERKAKQLRRDGWIPAVIYGQGENLTIQIENLPLRRVLREAGTTNLIDIEVGKSKHTVLAKDVQRHATRGDLIHVDFYEVDMAEKIVVEASLIAVGESAPVTDGLGTVAILLHSVDIECLPDNLISEIKIELEQIETPEDMIYVGDLDIPEGVTVLNEPTTPVARFEYLQAEIEEEEEEEEDLLFAPEADEVEVIAKGKPEDEDEEVEE
jgi:large subunit ribosomal protein L25